MQRFVPVFLLVAACSNDAGQPEVRSDVPLRTCGAVVSWQGTASEVVVSGEFNDWGETPLEATDDLWRAAVDASPGRYAYTLKVDGEVVTPGPADTTQWHEGNEVFSVRAPDCDVPAWDARKVEVNQGAIEARFEFLASASSGAALDPTSVNVVAGDTTLGAENVTVENGVVTVNFKPATPGKYSLRISGKDADGVAAENDDLWLPVWVEEAAFDWRDATMYLAFTDRFRDSDAQKPPKPDTGLADIAAFAGGDFGGVLEAIEEGYFEELGVNTLWLSPIYENPEGAYLGKDGSLYTGYHGYWPIDPFAAETAYGGDAALHAVIAAAHARGMRVLFDVVLNHVHEDHVYCAENPSWCQPTCVCGTDNCDWEGRALDCQFAPYLPDLNYRNPDIVDRVLDDVLKQMALFDVDGLRVDAAKHMDHVIMRTLRQRLDKIEATGAAPFYTVGETFTGDRGLIMQYVSDNELHGQFDFPLYYAVRGAFGGGGSFRDLEGAVAAGRGAYGTHLSAMSPFMGNHDVERMATEIAGNSQGPFGQTADLMANGPADTITEWNIINRMAMGFAFVLTQPGVPLIYYGDEIGLAGGGDPDNRRMMPTSLNANQTELLNRVKQLGVLRQQIPVLRRGTSKELWLDESVYVYVRAGEAGDAAIVAMNKGQLARTIDVTIPSALGLAEKTLKGANNPDRSFRIIDGVMQVKLDPWEYIILVPE